LRAQIKWRITQRKFASILNGSGRIGLPLQVNRRVAVIFNRVSEVPESAPNAENLAKNGAFETRRSAFTIRALTMPRRPTSFTWN
jgi:hypothetical protein